MPAAKRKEAPAPKRIRQARPGEDGLTLGQRMRGCMLVRARQLGISPEEYTQDRLLEEASRAAGRDPEKNPIITQQALSLILNNKTSESPATPAFAAVFGVEAIWLQYGHGHPSYLEKMLKGGPQ